MVINVKKDISDMIVNTDVMAELFGYTRQRINQLAKEGVLEKQAPGRFPLLKNIKKYIDFIRISQMGDDERKLLILGRKRCMEEKPKEAN